MEIEQRRKHYTLFIDECGDPNLEKYDRTFPMFTLCGILVSSDKLKWLENEINGLKRELWQDESVIFHSR